jgi:2-polyprenyl-3-methyl-5-hydroxy-6-metoxy-1,4-benzoquinol methylase
MAHKGESVAKQGKYQVIDCEICGFKHLDPIPTDIELNAFYKSRYFDQIKKGGRSPDIHRLIGKDDAAHTEREWLEKTFYTDINEILTCCNVRGDRRILDVGCGTGDFLKFMQEQGWKCTGIEPSEEGSSRATHSQITVYNCPLESFVSTHPKFLNSFDVISLLNVLEHVSSPKIIIEDIKYLLKPESGIVVIRVPNDFTTIQQFAQRKLMKEPWWVTVPDHINYFSIESLQHLLTAMGFEIIYTTVDFPMEFFLLMGEDYVGNPITGSSCHQKRKSFELSMPGETRRRFYHHLAEQGIGRNCIIFAKRIPEF